MKQVGGYVTTTGVPDDYTSKHQFVNFHWKITYGTDGVLLKPFCKLSPALNMTPQPHHCHRKHVQNHALLSLRAWRNHHRHQVLQDRGATSQRARSDGGRSFTPGERLRPIRGRWRGDGCWHPYFDQRIRSKACGGGSKRRRRGWSGAWPGTHARPVSARPRCHGGLRTDS